MLDHVAAVDDPGRALLEHGLRALEDLLVADAAAAAQQQRHARDRGHAVVLGEVVGGVGLDDVGAELDRLADEAHDAVDVAARLVAASPAALERERLDHQRHPRAVALGAQLADALEAVAAQAVLAGDVEEVDDDAGGVEADGVPDGVVDHERPRVLGRLGGVDVRRVGAQDERGLVAAGVALEQVGLADGELDRVRLGVDEHVDRLRHVLDPGEHRGLAGHPVVDRDVEAAARRRVEEAVEAVLLHGGWGH